MKTKWIQFTVANDNIPTFHSALKKVQEASKLEVGCVHYGAFVCSKDANTFTVLESWDCDESLESHRNSPHVMAFKERCGDMILKKVALDLHSL